MTVSVGYAGSWPTLEPPHLRTHQAERRLLGKTEHTTPSLRSETPDLDSPLVVQQPLAAENHAVLIKVQLCGDMRGLPCDGDEAGACTPKAWHEDGKHQRLAERTSTPKDEDRCRISA